MDGIVREQQAAAAVHGAVLVANATDVLYRGSCGLADRTAAIAGSQDSAFPVQSITKSFTAILVLQLVQEDRLALDETIAEHLPAFESPFNVGNGVLLLTPRFEQDRTKLVLRKS